MTDADKINILIKEGEGLTVEFKERYTPKIDRDISLLPIIFPLRTSLAEI